MLLCLGFNVNVKNESRSMKKEGLPFASKFDFAISELS